MNALINLKETFKVCPYLLTLIMLKTHMQFIYIRNKNEDIFDQRTYIEHINTFELPFTIFDVLYDIRVSKRRQNFFSGAN